LIHFFYRPNQAYLKKFPVSIFQESFLRYEDDVCFKELDVKLMGDIGPRDSVYFYNLRYAGLPEMCSIIESEGAKIINKPKLNGKLEMAEAFIAQGLPVPRHVVVKAGPLRSHELRSLRFPIIVKPISGSSGGKGIYFCEKESDLPKKVATDMIIQEYITSARDSIIRINTVYDQPVISVKVFAENGSPIINASANGRPEAYTPTQEEVALALAGAKVVGLDISGADMAQTDNGPMIIEINTVPGFTSGQMLGIKFEDYVVDLIVKRAREHKSLTLPL
jgi:glutathione synthase/RimK-type ligase-like ATP-grasp enzyme